MRIVCLVENTSRKGCLTEHGLSLYLETGEHKLLFDTGQSGIFLRNAQKLGVDLSAVDLAVISHGHYDHGGGLEVFLSVNDHAPVYMNEYALERHCAGPGRDIGLDPGLARHPRIRFSNDEASLGEDLMLFTGNSNPRPFPANSDGFTVIRDGEVFRDDFLHEQYLLIREGAQTFLISGCSHKGIRNVMHWMRHCPPDAVVGGFHLSNIPMDREGRQRLDEVADTLLEYPSVYYTCHCTGIPQYQYLKTRMRGQLEYLSAGDEWYETIKQEEIHERKLFPKL